VKVPKCGKTAAVVETRLPAGHGSQEAPETARTRAAEVEIAAAHIEFAFELHERLPRDRNESAGDLDEDGIGLDGSSAAKKGDCEEKRPMRTPRVEDGKRDT
jgi:hypothetical protein